MASDKSPLGPDIPMVEADGLLGALYQMDNGGFDPDRPFDGQPWTDEGERGKTRVDLAFRDVADCMAIGIMLACGFSRLRALASTRNDLYAATEEDPGFDPCAAIQQACCEMERRMGIYPNVPATEGSEAKDAHADD